jgi:hypothetical protein
VWNRLDDAFAVQRFIAHRPAHDLPHALHLVEAGKFISMARRRAGALR